MHLQRGETEPTRPPAAPNLRLQEAVCGPIPLFPIVIYNG
jgi:hypothetical protein